MSSSPPASSTKPKPRNEHALLKLIAAFKGLKCICLVLIAIAAFRLYQPGNFYTFIDWLAGLPLVDYSLGKQLFDKLVNVGPHQFIWLGLVALGYALIFGIEGTGLWLGKRWAEWLTVILTGSLIPFELYELFQKFTGLKLLALLINLAIVVYLIRVVRQKTSHA